MTARDAYTYWGGQRYVLVLITLALCTFLLWHHRLTSPDFTMIVCTAIVAYISGRTYQKTKVGAIE